MKNALEYLQTFVCDLYYTNYRNSYYAVFCHIILYQYINKNERLFRRIFIYLILIVVVHYNLTKFTV